MIFKDYDNGISDLKAIWNNGRNQKIEYNINNQTALLDMEEFYRRVPFYMNFSTKELCNYANSEVEDVASLHNRAIHVDGEPDEPVIDINADTAALAYVTLMRLLNTRTLQQDAAKISLQNMDRSNKKLLEKFEEQ